jgi:uncharacterized protein
MQTKKVVIDTNLWISFLISQKLPAITELLESNKFLLLYSKESIIEIFEVFERKKFEKLYTAKVESLLIYFFDTYGVFVNTISKIDICRDQDDNFLLNLAVDGNADYLITGDKDLLILQKIENTTILTMSDFLINFE